MDSYSFNDLGWFSIEKGHNKIELYYRVSVKKGSIILISSHDTALIINTDNRVLYSDYNVSSLTLSPLFILKKYKFYFNCLVEYKYYLNIYTFTYSYAESRVFMMNVMTKMPNTTVTRLINLTSSKNLINF